jgi:hypothetical protein
MFAKQPKNQIVRTRDVSLDKIFYLGDVKKGQIVSHKFENTNGSPILYASGHCNCYSVKYSSDYVIITAKVEYAAQFIVRKARVVFRDNKEAEFILKGTIKN